MIIVIHRLDHIFWEIGVIFPWEKPDQSQTIIPSREGISHVLLYLRQYCSVVITHKYIYIYIYWSQSPCCWHYVHIFIYNLIWYGLLSIWLPLLHAVRNWCENSDLIVIYNTNVCNRHIKVRYKLLKNLCQRGDMETLSALLTFCEEIPPATGGFPHEMASFGVFFCCYHGE